MAGKSALDADLEREKREIAEKCARYLGWIKGTFEEGPQILEGGWGWETVGQMIEHLEKRGWLINWSYEQIKFGRKPIRNTWYQPTKNYSTIIHGYHLAIARAFVDAMEIIRGRESDENKGDD